MTHIDRNLGVELDSRAESGDPKFSPFDVIKNISFSRTEGTANQSRTRDAVGDAFSESLADDGGHTLTLPQLRSFNFDPFEEPEDAKDLSDATLGVEDLLSAETGGNKMTPAQMEALYPRKTGNGEEEAFNLNPTNPKKGN